ncbi:hypothetical protein C8R43DRAFT_1168141 [Mycena crocata]|nr:hypothetical protein C8R43DRAFT_1168141 [Mycena crocata]
MTLRVTAKSSGHSPEQHSNESQSMERKHGNPRLPDMVIVAWAAERSGIGIPQQVVYKSAVTLLLRRNIRSPKLRLAVCTISVYCFNSAAHVGLGAGGRLAVVVCPQCLVNYCENVPNSYWFPCDVIFDTTEGPEGTRGDTDAECAAACMHARRGGYHTRWDFAGRRQKEKKSRGGGHDRVLRASGFGVFREAAEPENRVGQEYAEPQRLGSAAD